MFALEGAVEFPHTQGCLYMSVCVFYVHFICLCVCVYPSELLLESQGCLYVYYVCYMLLCVQVSCCWSREFVCIYVPE